MWMEARENEFGRLVKGIRWDGIYGMDTMYLIRRNDIPKYCKVVYA